MQSDDGLNARVQYVSALAGRLKAGKNPEENGRWEKERKKLPEDGEKVGERFIAGMEGLVAVVTKGKC